VAIALNGNLCKAMLGGQTLVKKQIFGPPPPKKKNMGFFGTHQTRKGSEHFWWDFSLKG